jgi:hypothetical protein
MPDAVPAPNAPESGGKPRGGGGEGAVERPYQLVYLMRHAESESNVNMDADIRDPNLTALGRQQAREMHDRLEWIVDYLLNDNEGAPYQLHEILVVSSPLTRALQTTCIAFQNITLAQPVIAYPGIVELGEGAPCDVGRPKSVLQNLFAPSVTHSSVSFDWSYVRREKWFKLHKDVRHLAYKKKTRLKKNQFIDYLLEQKKKKNISVVFVITHWGIIHALTKASLMNGAIKKYQLNFNRSFTKLSVEY